MTRSGGKDVVLFIDELHTLVGAGGAEGAIDASNVLKPALARGEIQCIGATTLDEYRKYIEKDGALERRFQSVNVEPPARSRPSRSSRVCATVRGPPPGQYTDEALRAAVELSTRYINDRVPPGQGHRRDGRGRRPGAHQVHDPAARPARDSTRRSSSSTVDKDEAVASPGLRDGRRAARPGDQLRKKKEQIQDEWRESSRKRVRRRGRRSTSSRSRLQDDRHPADAPREGGGRAPAPDGGRAHTTVVSQDDAIAAIARASAAPARPQGPAPPHGHVHLPRPVRRRQDLPLQGARRVHVR